MMVDIYTTVEPKFGANPVVKGMARQLFNQIYNAMLSSLTDEEATAVLRKIKARMKQAHGV